MLPYCLIMVSVTTITCRSLQDQDHPVTALLVCHLCSVYYRLNCYYFSGLTASNPPSACSTSQIAVVTWKLPVVTVGDCMLACLLVCRYIRSVGYHSKAHVKLQRKQAKALGNFVRGERWNTRCTSTGSNAGRNYL